MRNPLWLIKQLKRWSYYKDYAMFPALLVLIYKGTLCYLRSTSRKANPSHAAIAGFVAGFVALFQRPKSGSQGRVAWMTYVMGRALECFYNFGIARNVYKAEEWHSTMLMSLTIGLCAYCYSMERRLMPKSLQKYFKQFLNFTKVEY